MAVPVPSNLFWAVFFHVPGPWRHHPHGKGVRVARQFGKICMFDVTLVAHKYYQTKGGRGVIELPTVKQHLVTMHPWGGSIGDLVHNGYDRPLPETSSPQRFNCTACGEEAWTGMTICAFGCRVVFLYHPVEIELEVPDEVTPIVGYNTAGATDPATDSAWVVTKDTGFVYQPGGRPLEFHSAEALEKYIGSLVRGFSEIVMGRPYEPGRGERDMGAMRQMIKKEVHHRIKWRDDNPEYRLMKASRGAFLGWSGAILKGAWVPQDATERPPQHLMPDVFPKKDREGSTS